MKTLKELYDKYKQDYQILVYGKPLEQNTTPFSYLPKNKQLMECEIVELKIQEEEFIERGFKFPSMKPTKSIKKKGYISVYVK